MKKIIGLITILSILISCNSNHTAKNVDIKAETLAINKVLDLWHLDAAETNFDSYFGAMTAKSVFVGTDASEVWKIEKFKDFSKPYFDKGSAWSFESVDRNVYLDSEGKIAWFDEILDTWMGVCRGSGVLKKIDSGWKIEHYVLSITIPNDNIKDVIKINKEKDSLFLNHLLK